MGNITKKTILDAFHYRHACKEFDSEKKISAEDFDFILETIRLSPSSFGLEAWKFLVVQNNVIREKLKPYTWGGQKQLPTASHLIIALHRTSKYLRFDGMLIKENLDRKKLPDDIKTVVQGKIKSFQENDFDLLSHDNALADWAGKQTYIPLGNMLTVAAMIGIDSCPMEGFNRQAVSGILEEELSIQSSEYLPAYMVAFGYRKNTQPEKIRRAISDVIEWAE